MRWARVALVRPKQGTTARDSDKAQGEEREGNIGGFGNRLDFKVIHRDGADATFKRKLQISEGGSSQQGVSFIENQRVACPKVPLVVCNRSRAPIGCQIRQGGTGVIDDPHDGLRTAEVAAVGTAADVPKLKRPRCRGEVNTEAAVIARFGGIASRRESISNLPRCSLRLARGVATHY